ncbi:MAG: adenylate/guanylate cyclase domain-containing protein [Acidimicrobiia bacterium]
MSGTRTDFVSREGDLADVLIDRHDEGKPWIMTRWDALLRRIDRRVAVDGDSETRRFQKVLVVVVAFIGSIATLFNAVPLFGGGLDSIGWSYIASAAFIFAGAVALLVRPRAYVPIAFVLLLDVLIFTAIAQVLSGGLTSGLYALPWTIFAPLGAALALGSRYALAQLALFTGTLVVVVLLEPLSRELAAPIDPQVLISFNVPSLLSLGLMAGASALYLIRQVERFRGRADGLLLNVLPSSIAARLKSGESPIADRVDNVTVLFADIVGFTPLSSGADPREIVDMLNQIFSDFDALARKHGIEKIKTIGDSYMAVSGLSAPRRDHAQAMIDFALEMLDGVASRKGLDGRPIWLRIGINTGAVVAGVIGRDRFIYDLWGDTVNVASRMESHGIADRILVTRAVKESVGDRYRFEERPPIEIKGKGPTVTYALDRSGRRRLPTTPP